MSAHHLVDQALAALRSVTSPDDVARRTRESADEIERAWRRSPLVAGLAGDLIARSELVNRLAGERVLDPYARAKAGAALRIRRGKYIRFVVHRSDGSSEEKALPKPDRTEEDDSLDTRVDETRNDLATNETALVAVTSNVPALVRERPKPWAIWLWPVRWVLSLVHRNATDAWRRAQQLVADTKRELENFELRKQRRDDRERMLRDRWYGELRILIGGGPASQGIREIELEIVSGLPEGVELVGLSGELRAAAVVDAVITVERDGLYAPASGGEPVRLGDAEHVIAELRPLLARARALTLARRARDKLGIARAELDAELERHEAQFRGRISRIDKLGLSTDRGTFKRSQLARVKPMIVASVNAVMEHASVHMGSELAQLGASWISAIANAQSGDDLKAAIAKIEHEWPTAAKRIAEEVRVLVNGGAGGVARDLIVEAVSGLRAHGLPEEHLRTPKRAPEVAPVTILPSLVAPQAFTLGGNWLSGLFRSFDARKADIREKVHARIEHIKEVAGSEILDAEPEIHAAIDHALDAQIDSAIELQLRWHEQAVAKEYEAVALDRQKLAPLTKSRETLAAAITRVDELARALEAEQPGAAAAGIAAAS